MVHKS